MPALGNQGKKLPIIISKGSTFAPHLFRLVGKTTGNPIDITGSTIRAAIRKDYGSVQKFDMVCSIVDAEAGYFVISMPAAVTGTIPYLGPVYEPANQYIWSLEIELASGFVMPICYGPVKVYGEVA